MTGVTVLARASNTFELHVVFAVLYCFWSKLVHSIMSSSRQIRIAIDRGGTFCDLYVTTSALPLVVHDVLVLIHDVTKLGEYPGM
jgi:hypothetical protein